MKKKLAPISLIFLGLFIVLGAFFYGAGNALPYQDATPELIAYQDNNAKKAYIVFVLGLLISACGISWLRLLSKTP